jgi:hypothetical protein
MALMRRRMGMQMGCGKEFGRVGIRIKAERDCGGFVSI